MGGDIMGRSVRGPNVGCYLGLSLLTTSKRNKLKRDKLK
jgi:hypothetical protein